MRILVSLGTDFLWKFDGVYRRWNAFCVNRWHSNRFYTINQWTEKRRDTKLKLSTRTTGILVSLGNDFFWKFDGVYRRWNAFCINRWHSNRFYTINQWTEKWRDTKVKLSTRTTGILFSLGTDFLWKFDGVYGGWNAFCVNRWHSNWFYTINQWTEKCRDTKLKLSTRTTGILVSLGTDFLWKFDGVYRCWNAFCVNRWHSNRFYTINQWTEKRRDTKLKLSTRTTGILVSLGTDFLWKFDGVYRCWNAFCVNHWHSNRYYTINQGTEKRRDTTLIHRVLFKLETRTGDKNKMTMRYPSHWGSFQSENLF